MCKIKKSNELLWLMGIIFVAIGVTFADKANLGVSMIAAPAFIISEALLPLSSFFSVGASEYLLQGVILIVLCLTIRRFNWKFLTAFAVAVIYGYTLNFFLWIARDIVVEAVWARWVTLIIGDVITGLGVACYFKTYMPVQVYELFVSQSSEKFNVNIAKMKWIFDLSLLAVSIILALTLFGDVGSFDFSTLIYSSYHSIGLGTIVTTLINSPIINTMSKLIDKFFDPTPLFPKLKSRLSI